MFRCDTDITLNFDNYVCMVGGKMILTEDIIKGAAREAENIPLYESFSLEKSLRFDEKEHYDLFISHSFKDKDYIIGLKHLFEKLGYKIYIDWIEDTQLDRSCVDVNTAQLIKNRLKACKALAYIATVNTPSSKWCPWELGLGDGMLGKVCILPVMKGSYNGQEYLGLYPYLDYALTEIEKKKEFWINDNDDKNKYTSLRSWLNGGALTFHNK